MQSDQKGTVRHEVPLDLQTFCLVILEPRRDDVNKGIRFTDEFKRDAVAQVVERGYAVSEALLMAWMPPPTGIVMCHCDVSESIIQRESIHVRSHHDRHRPLQSACFNFTGLAPMERLFSARN
jgi:hypothetical protein